MSMPSLPNLRGAVDLSSLVNKPQRGAVNTAGGTRAPGEESAPVSPGTQVPVPQLVLDGTDQNFTAILDLSNQVPVIVDLWAEEAPQCAELSPILEKLVLGFQGRLILVRVNAVENPGLTQAFQAQTVPTTAAVLAGRPLPLFAGVAGEADIFNLFEQVLELAAQNGVVGIAKPAGAPAGESGAAVAPPAPALPPLHQEAFDAAERADYPAAIAAWEKALKQNPNDAEAKAGLAQISLLHRLQGKALADIRAAAAANPDGLEQQLDVADLDVSGGHVEDAFDRLLVLFPKLDQDGKNAVRARLLDLFEVVGLTDPAVNAARMRLTNLLY
ncbi:tetratricopeptide repeat protein [Aurantimicrobium minutum]|uniref:tetratricopeptide repeat protein n=1 Tax=Aurantimicrobium minutum TaxID=708131 RepID=UPI002473E314|nr:tetratricopeptide repeat protein [Aurantimicrobium minutum]MDH6255659.1 putative thioredoxin [Aurantimicrobium minutum]